MEIAEKLRGVVIWLVGRKWFQKEAEKVLDYGLYHLIDRAEEEGVLGVRSAAKLRKFVDDEETVPKLAKKYKEYMEE